jgi:anti-sigma factor RsiW
MQCDIQPEALGSYLDGELPVEEMTTVRAHILECPRCAADMADMAILKRQLRTFRGHFAPGAEFRQRIREQIAPKPSRWQFLSFAPYLAALGAMAVVLLAITISLTHSRRSDALAEVADLHTSALASSHPLDVVSSDHHTVKPWFQGKIPFTFNIPELSGTEFSLLGGRLAYFEQQPAAQVLIGLRKHEISMFVLRVGDGAQAALPRTNTVLQRDGFRIETWEQNRLRFIIITDADAATLGQLGRAVQQANQEP